MDRSETELRRLMLAGLQGDAGAYRVLLDDLRRRLRAYFVRRLGHGAAAAEDLVQDTLIAIHTRRHTYDRGQPFTPWAFTIARYKLIDHYRRSGRRHTVALDDVGDLFVDEQSGASDARGDVERALSTLPERTRSLIRSVKLDELSCAEAGAANGMSGGAVKVAVHRGLKALRARFGDGGDDD